MSIENVGAQLGAARIEDHYNRSTGVTEAPREPTLTEKCAQFEERNYSIMSALGELDGHIGRIFGSGYGTAQNQNGKPESDIPGIDSRFSNSLTALACIEGRIRTLNNMLQIRA